MTILPVTSSTGSLNFDIIDVRGENKFNLDMHTSAEPATLAYQSQDEVHNANGKMKVYADAANGFNVESGPDTNGTFRLYIDNNAGGIFVGSDSIYAQITPTEVFIGNTLAWQTGLGLIAGGLTSPVHFSNDGTFSLNTDTRAPTEKATKTYADTKLPSTYLDLDGTLAANSDVKIASQKATKTYADTKIALANLDTDSTFAANSDTKVPSQKAVKTALALKADLDNRDQYFYAESIGLFVDTYLDLNAVFLSRDNPLTPGAAIYCQSTDITTHFQSTLFCYSNIGGFQHIKLDTDNLTQLGSSNLVLSDDFGDMQVLLSVDQQGFAGGRITITKNGFQIGNPSSLRSALSLGTSALLDSSDDTTLAADSSSLLPTQHAVKTYVTSAALGALHYIGQTDCSANPNYPAAVIGDTYRVSVAGKIGGASGASVDVGDLYIALVANAGGTQASVGSSWDIVEHNLIGALQAANNLSDLTSASTARSNLGLGTLATQSGTFSGTSSGTNTGDNATNTQYSGLVSNATHTGDATGATVLTLATVNSNVGTFGSVTKSTTQTVNAKGLVTAISEATITPAVGSITGLGTNVATALANTLNAASGLVGFSGALGTPISGTGTNITGLPISTGVSGLGANVATALGNTLNAASGLVGFSGALGTPTSGVGTNLTGTASSLTAGNVTTNANLTGHVTSVGNATVLGSFTSAQLLAALSNPTGTGSSVFSASPTFTGTLTCSALTATNTITGVAGNFTGRITTTVAPALSASAFLVSGALRTGGTGTTTFPHALIEPTGTTAVTTWSTSGTVIGINEATGFAGNFLDFHIAGGSSVFAVSSAGSITIVGGGNVVLDTTTGTKIGTSTSQKLGFFNATPIVQPSGAAEASVATTASSNIAPFGYTTQAQADAIITLLNEMRSVLVSLGLMKGSA